MITATLVPQAAIAALHSPAIQSLPQKVTAMRITIFVLCLSFLFLAAPHFDGTEAAAFIVLRHMDAETGRGPSTALVRVESGELYGTTAYGGLSDQCADNFGCGTVFRIDDEWDISIVHEFTQEEGSHASQLIEGSDGHFYGTTRYHGSPPEGSNCALSGGCGTVFRMDQNGTVTVLHHFSGATADGTNPSGGLVQGEDGNFYGVAGNNGGGVVYRISPEGYFSIAHTFDVETEGGSPVGPLVVGTDGALYGITTRVRNVTSKSIFYRMDLQGTVSELLEFGDGQSGGDTGLLLGSDGNFYGTSEYGGAYGWGMIFRITPTGTYTILHSFNDFGTDGLRPRARLAQAADGQFYGTASRGGFPAMNPDRSGVVFRMNHEGSVTVLHTFEGSDGNLPLAEPVMGTDGALYGTTFAGGANSSGVIYRVEPNGVPGLAALTIEPASVSGGSVATGTIYLEGPAPNGGALISLDSDTPEYASVPPSVAIPTGDTNATFLIRTTHTAGFVDVVISAAYDGETETTPFSVAPLYLSELQMQQEEVAGGAVTNGFVSLSDSAGPAGEVITLASHSIHATVPLTVTIAPGTSWVPFDVQTSPVSSTEPVTISASFEGAQLYTSFNVVPAASIELLWIGTDRPGATGGDTAYAAVQLSGGAPAGGALVSLYSTHPAVASLPATVLVEEGTSQANFEINTSPVEANVEVSVTAAYKGITATTDLVVMTPIDDFGVNESSVEGGLDVTGQIKLSTPAPEGGAIVALSSSDPAIASLPETVFVPEGQAETSFTVTTHTVDRARTVILSSEYRGELRNTTMEILPANGTGSDVYLYFPTLSSGP